MASDRWAGAWRGNTRLRHCRATNGGGIETRCLAGAWRGCDWLRHRSGLIGVAEALHDTATDGGGSEEQGKGKGKSMATHSKATACEGKACERMASDSDGKAGIVR